MEVTGDLDENVFGGGLGTDASNAYNPCSRL